MAAVSTLFVTFATLIISSNADKGKYGDCSYILEPNDGIYDDKLSAEYQNLSLPTRAYTMGYCNYFYDHEESRHISWSYYCDSTNDKVTVSLYEGAINDCDTGTPATYTYTRADNTDDSWYCGTEDCTLTVQRFNNEGNTSCDSTFALNTYSIVNGQCEMASDIGYYLSASCANDTAAYTYGIYGDSECATASESGEVTDDSCPSEKAGYPNAIGSLKYMIDECMGSPFEPTTTMPASTDRSDCTGEEDYATYLASECSSDMYCAEDAKCSDCVWQNGAQSCTIFNATCKIKFSAACACEEVWTSNEDGTIVTCDEEVDDCVTYMVKMTFVTIIVSWLWI